jgi:drug/metabolite transporter (DMT)-like permease
MAIFLALAAAATYGGADFLGGLVTRKAPVITVVLLSQLAGGALLLILFPFGGSGPFDQGAVAWGAASGVAGAFGVVLLYRGLARGRMSVVAPITAVEAASVPVVYGLITGERPSVLALLGVILALVSVALVSMSPDPDRAPGEDGEVRSGLFPLPPGVLEALGAGLMFGAFFILLRQGGATSGLWPLFGARISSFAVIGTAALIRRPSFRVERNTGLGIAGSGLLDLTANFLYLVASRRGLLSLVAVLTSMYPASTVLLARVVLGERLTFIQMVGLGVAMSGIVLIAVG